MKAVSKILAGGVAFAALASAAPAAAQYYPQYPNSGYGQPNVIGQVINQVLGGGTGYGVNSQVAVQRCAAAVEQRINYQYNRGAYGQGGYGAQGGYSGYGGYGGYNPGYNGYANNPSTARVLGVTSIERRSNNGLRVRGIATARATPVGYGGYGGQGGYGGYGGYGGQVGYGGYAGQPPQQAGELTFRCNLDYRGYVTNVDVDRNRYAYGGYRNY
jgi:hypothetical protein